MKFFTPVEDGYVLLRSRGVFKQTTLHERGGKLYAANGGGFIGLLNYQNGTTKPNVAWVETSIETKANLTSGYLERA